MSANKESTVTYRHELNHSFKKKGIKHLIQERIIDGTAQGLSFMFLKKIGDTEFYKIYGKETGKGMYSIEEQTGTSKDTLKSSEKSETEVVKMLKTDKSGQFDFILNFIQKLKGTFN